MTLLGIAAHPDWRTTANPSYWRLGWVTIFAMPVVTTKLGIFLL